MVKDKSKFLNYAAIASVLLLGLYSNIRLAVRNYNLQRRIETTQAEVRQMQERNERLRLILSYYQTPSYQEVEARRRLQVKKPEETVLVIKGLDLTTAELNLLEDQVYQEPIITNREEKSNFQKWREYLFKR
jgi:cell division protein FtsB